MTIDYSKHPDKLVPAVIQDSRTRRVLMLGYMNEAALENTRSSGLVTFYSRSRDCLWTKGETSGNLLHVREILLDCDQDALLILAEPAGPVCHTGEDTCFRQKNTLPFLSILESVIDNRREASPETSYTASLFRKGRAKIAQKVVEEAGELAIEAMGENHDLFLEEAADLIYHVLVLLADKGLRLDDVLDVLRKRHK
jgi:phosphoribosyl-AMP cyclohydrolase / phosphoribosyl-ATP pyrophosphohydrolase